MKIIAIGKGQYASDNSNWTEGNTIPIVIDPTPNTLWASWGADQWDIFFLDSSGDYVTDLNLEDYTVIADDSARVFQYNKIYNQIITLLPE